MPLTGQASYTELDCKLYYNTGNNASPVWVEMKRVEGVKVPLSKEEVETFSRESRWKTVIAAWKEIGLDFTYKKKRRVTDSIFAAIKNSFVSDTPIQFAVMDDLITTSGATGWKFYGQVFGLDEDQGKPVKADVKVKLTEYYENDTLIEPAYVTV